MGCVIRLLGVRVKSLKSLKNPRQLQTAESKLNMSSDKKTSMGSVLKKLFLFQVWVFVFSCHMMVYLCDLLMFRLLGRDKRSRFVRKGQCERSGLCCQSLGIELPQAWISRPKVVAFFRAWYARIHNFQSLGPPQGSLLPFSCNYLRVGNTCGIYPFRPKLCREYPNGGFFGKVELHRGCGYWFVEREKQGSFEETLMREKHQSERREFLRSE